ncbi:uncharacterized protein SOCE26_010490 [Sorangium cellulosum]|uniref:Secreted protein n=1 Tax=Sorangium cellulosum TaxID=56 RepID=A0A2L0EK50_SORCE|nr:hypothetical protein [Sorangium cellulosum]AUX39654.1 uncharacterized protein SOCE26_010490 [Sorangium cellulosum]
MRLVLGVALSCAALMTACSPDLGAVTVPPPGAVAELDNDEETVELTRGIALGFECTFQGAPCAAAAAEIDDPNIASVFPAYVDLLSRDHGNGALPTGKPRAVFVIVGGKAGSTTLQISSDDGDLAFSVTVVDP